MDPSLQAQLYDTLINAFVGLVTAAVPILTTFAVQWLREQTKASAAARLSDAAQRAGGLVVNTLDGPQTDLVGYDKVKEEATRAAVTHVVASMGDTIAKLGGSPDKVDAMVRGEVGKLLAPALASQKGAQA